MSKHTTITSQVALWKWIILRTDTTKHSTPFSIGAHTCSYCQVYFDYDAMYQEDACGECPIGNNCKDTHFYGFYNSVYESDFDARIDLPNAQDCAEDLIDFLEPLIEYGTGYNDN